MKDSEVWSDPNEMPPENDPLDPENQPTPYKKLRVDIKTLDLKIKGEEEKLAEIKSGNGDRANLPLIEARLESYQKRREKRKQEMMRFT